MRRLVLGWACRGCMVLGFASATVAALSPTPVWEALLLLGVLLVLVGYWLGLLAWHR